MNKFDKNFHLNMSPMYAVFFFMLFMLWASEAKANDVEEVIVVAQQENTIKTDPVTSSSLISAIMPAFTWNAGGYGGFIGYNERGAQTVHTSVIVNGIPANDPGAGWYDFGHDFVNGQTVKVVSGANGVLYGSGSIAGTILIQDTIERGITLRVEDGVNYARVAPIDQLEFSVVSDSMGSVRSDNNEEDNYENKTARFNVDAGKFNIVGKFTEYDYDYDNCFDDQFESTNNCLQSGVRYNIATRSDNITIGRNYVESEYFSDTVLNYTNKSYTDFVRFSNEKILSDKVYIFYGVDADQRSYETQHFSHNDENYGAFFTANVRMLVDLNIGIRQGNDNQNAVRVGAELGNWFFNVGNSFRKPTLYEKFGDEFVDGNKALASEEGIGYELGFGVLSAFKFDFKETIEYVDGFYIGELWVLPTYQNTGSYTTEGIRFANVFGPFAVNLKYTKSDQPRVPKYMGMLSWQDNFFNTNFRIKYAFSLDRKPSAFDIIPQDKLFLDDLHKVNFYITKKLNNGITLGFKAENITNEQVEVLPFYPVEGREMYLTLDYKW